jgi:hypothetical protein
MARKKVIRKSGNAVVSKVTWKSIMRSKAFRIGFEEVQNNMPFQYDAFTGKEAWYYERGRQFAAMGYSAKFKNGNRILDDAVATFAEGYRMKFIR